MHPSSASVFDHPPNDIWYRRFIRCFHLLFLLTPVLQVRLGKRTWIIIWKWSTGYVSIHKGSLNVHTQENAYKICTRWYKVPHLLHKIFLIAVGTALQMRAHFSTFGGHILIWSLFGPRSMKLSGMVVVFMPSQYLLHYSFLSIRIYKKSLLIHMINAARLCVLVHWRDISLPSLKQWFIRVRSFTSTWWWWIHYKTSDKYKQIMSMV